VFRRRRRRAELDARAEDAQREAQVSRDRLHATREQVIRPLTERAELNQFAELIRASLMEGHEQ
jgi:hypothetical protein